MNVDEKRDHTDRFTGLAETYSRGRPTYPAEAIDYIVQKCALSVQSLLIDVGCGTGISSRILAARDINVIGIEPNADMLAQAKSEIEKPSDVPLQSISGELDYQCGTAESTGLSGGIADAVLCAQAFHWFRPFESISEFCRILKPQGWIALMWNERNEADGFTREYGDLLRTFPDTSKVEMQRGKAGEALGKTELVQNYSVTYFDNQQTMDLAGFQDRAFSASYVPKQPPMRQVVEDGLKRLFDAHNVNGFLSLRYKTSVYLAQRK